MLIDPEIVSSVVSNGRVGNQWLTLITACRYLYNVIKLAYVQITQILHNYLKIKFTLFSPK